jgi:hypothetical protein
MLDLFLFIDFVWFCIWNCCGGLAGVTAINTVSGLMGLRGDERGTAWPAVGVEKVRIIE